MSQQPASTGSPNAVAAATPSSAVIILDSDAGEARDLEQILRAAGCDVALAHDAESLQARLAEGDFDVVIADDSNLESRKTQDGGSFTIQDAASQTGPAVIVISNFGTTEGAVAALRDGAAHYAFKPIVPEEILLAVRRATESRRIRKENLALRHEVERRTSLGSLTMRDPRMREICSLVETVARTRATVLLLGQSGTGKSVLARTIHGLSPRKNGPFVEVNCGALPENLLESELFGHVKGSFTGALRDRPGRFESASGGTIFLDEIGNAPQSLQLRLLRVLQERVVERVGENRARNVDVRVILATNQDLAAAVREGRFREDLYYRIHVVTIELPPLRERPSDIPELARRFLANASADLGRRVHGIAAEAMDALLAYPWPGNVRELENAIERAVATGHSETLQFSDLPAAVRRQDRQSMVASGGTAPAAADSMSLDEVPLGKLSDMLAACERRFLQRALDACRQNRSRAAALLGLHRATLYQRMKRAGFGTPDRP